MLLGLNLSSDKLTENYCPIIGGGNPQYRQGLQFAVRDKKLYFGFWHMDVHGNTTLEMEKWYHVAVKYNFQQQSVSLFVNGKKDCEAFNVKSFIGKEGPFWIGQSVTIHNFLGMMDELAIWNRALSDDEILSLYKGQKITPNSDDYMKKWLVGGVLTILLILFVMRRKKNLNENMSDNEPSEELRVTGISDKMILEKEITSDLYKNRIYLFGTPSVFSGNDDVTHKISPKMMELFVFLIINKCFGRDILQLKEVTETLWSDMESNKANNNRRVIVSRLKTFLVEFTDIHLVTDSKNEIGLQINENVYIDLMRYKDIVNVGVNIDTVYEFLDILGRGTFLKNFKSDWIDGYYADLYDETVYFLSEQIEKNTFEEKILLAISERLISIEQCNEEAMSFMVKYYHRKGKVSVAENVYSHFCEKFHRIYNSFYKKTFDDVVSDK